MTRKAIISQIADSIKHVAPQATSLLYGSEARGEAEDQSDIDILIVLPDEEANNFSKRKIEINDCLYPIEVDTGVIISPLVVLRSVWEKMTTPFTLNVANDGIVL